MELIKLHYDFLFITFISFCFFISLTLVNCKNEQQLNLNLEDSNTIASVFAPNIISTGLYERDIAISPSGDEIIYTLGDYKQSRRCLVYVTKDNNYWNPPEILNISGQYQDIEPFYANNGNTLFFASDRPIENDSLRNDYNIWVSERSGNIWGNPKPLSKNINTEGDEFYPSVSKNGNLYFTATRKDGIGREDIFVSIKKHGEYQNPVVLDSSINTSTYEFNAFINPDENLLIFSSYGRSDDIGGGDLYFSTKNENGKWSQSKNMGSQINSSKLDYCPFVDYGNNNFYFTSERVNIDTMKFQNINELKSYANNPQNGMGDIYRIGFDQIKIFNQ